jgi:hypothetical protein
MNAQIEQCSDRPRFSGSLYFADAPMTVTGPSSPEGSGGQSGLYGATSANVYFVAPGCRSPIIRFTQALITFTLIVFAPGFSAEVTSTR